MSPTSPATLPFPHTPATTGNGHTGTVAVTLLWRPEHALQVELHITNPGRPTAGDGETPDWVVARDLLAAGLDGPAGLGDISLFPDLPGDGYRVELVLRDCRGIGRNLALTLPVAALRRYLTQTYEQVPAGAENYAFDMAELRGEATS